MHGRMLGKPRSKIKPDKRKTAKLTENRILLFNRSQEYKLLPFILKETRHETQRKRFWRDAGSEYRDGLRKKSDEFRADIHRIHAGAMHMFRRGQGAAFSESHEPGMDYG
jgi:hypothetical protein